MPLGLRDLALSDKRLPAKVASLLAILTGIGITACNTLLDVKPRYSQYVSQFLPNRDGSAVYFRWYDPNGQEAVYRSGPNTNASIVSFQGLPSPVWLSDVLADMIVFVDINSNRFFLAGTTGGSASLINTISSSGTIEPGRISPANVRLAYDGSIFVSATVDRSVNIKSDYALFRIYPQYNQIAKLSELSAPWFDVSPDGRYVLSSDVDMGGVIRSIDGASDVTKVSLEGVVGLYDRNTVLIGRPLANRKGLYVKNLVSGEDRLLASYARSNPEVSGDGQYVFVQDAEVDKGPYLRVSGKVIRYRFDGSASDVMVDPEKLPLSPPSYPG